MRTISISASALGTVAWPVDRNCNLMGVSASTSVAFSTDPALVRADLSGPATNIIRTNVLAYAPGSFIGPLNHPLKKGEYVQCAFSGAGTALLYLT